MVITSFTKKFVQQLEMFLLRSNNFQLRGEGYDLLLFLPNESHNFGQQYSLLISAKVLDNRSQRQVIMELLRSFKIALNFEEYSLISTLNIIVSDDPLVKNINSVVPFYKDQDAEIELNTSINGFNLHGATLVRSSVLKNLIKGNTIKIKLSNQKVLSGKLIGIDTQYTIYIEPDSDNLHATTIDNSFRQCLFTEVESVLRVENQ